MAVRILGGSGLRRAARGSAGFVVLAVALFTLAAAVATWPAVRHAGSSFLAGGAEGYGEAAPGDHLQTGYRLWLPGHQLEHGRAPWVDPYTFRPESTPRANFEAWPYAIPYWPLSALLGPVRAWNAFVLLTFIGAGLLTLWWLRELELPRGPALVGALAFEMAPYRTLQSAGHLLGPMSLMLPLALAAFERSRRGSLWWLALSGGAIATIPLSGQVHLALGAIPFYCLYVLCRTRNRTLLLGAAAGVVAALIAGVLVHQVSIVDSTGAGGRSLGSVSFYSADGLDLITRHLRHGSESFVFLGWLLPVLAVAGLVVLGLDRRWRLFAALGVGALVPMLLALGTNLPLYTALWHAFPPFRFPRVPERLMPIACLCLAALAAFAVDRLRWKLVTPLVIALLLVDLHVHVFGASKADASNAAYAQLRKEPPGRLLELPVYLPDLHYGSVYQYYDMKAQRQRPFGYSTIAPVAADILGRDLQRLNCGDWTGNMKAKLDRLGVRYVTLHRGLYPQFQSVPARSWFAWRTLQKMGFGPVASSGIVTLFAPGAKAAKPPMDPPRSLGPIYCGGWYQPTKEHPRVRTMSWPHAPVWVKGDGRLTVLATAPTLLQASFSVDGKRQERDLVSTVTIVHLNLKGPGWHLVTIDVPHMIRLDGRPIGLDVIMVTRGIVVIA